MNESLKQVHEHEQEQEQGHDLGENKSGSQAITSDHEITTSLFSGESESESETKL